MRRSLLLAALLVLPTPSAATDLTLSLGGFADYDSNVFRRDKNVKDDFLFRLRPAVRVHEDRGQDLDYSLRYTLPVEFSVNHGNELNDIDHWADVSVNYGPGRRWETFAENDFRYLRSTLRTTTIVDPGVPPGDPPLIDTGRDRVTLNRARVGGRYLFSERVTGSLETNHRLFETTRDNRQDNWEARARADLSYQLSPRHAFGSGLTFAHQDFEQSTAPLVNGGGIVASTANSLNLFLTWQWQIDETTGLSLTAGPAYIHIEQDAPDSNVGFVDIDTTDDTVDVFVNTSLIRRWAPNLNTAMRYTRSQGTGAGVGGSLIRDAVGVSGQWKPRELWTLTIRGDWVLRQSVNDSNASRVINPIAGNQQSTEVDSERWSGQVRLSNRMFRNTDVFVQGVYNQQTSEATTIQSAENFDGWIATVGFIHTFEPLKLW